MSAQAAEAQARRLYTIGHGNRTLEELLALLWAVEAGCLIDVRAHPGSRRHPHFGRTALEGVLPRQGIEYVWEGEALGGRRRLKAATRHTALRNESFRAYAHHMESLAFRGGIERVLALAQERRAALMCAERLPWHCHRYLIADYLVAHGHAVLHVIGSEAPRLHAVNRAARLVDDELVYDALAHDALDLE
jgi:uncharacterized protein (DUF488 family)